MRSSIQFIFLVAFVLAAHLAAGQAFYIVKGQIVDEYTGEPLSAASVAAQNTTSGTVSDSAGFFRLRLPSGGYTISVSYTGYATKDVRVNNQSALEDLVIPLEPRSNELEEVAIVLDLEVKDGWENYGKLFTENFIGQSKFSRACIIRNPEVLRFFLYKNRRTLKVTAREPLIVENYALGYTLKFAIDSFVNNFATRTSMFVGYPIFEEMEGTPEQTYLWAKNRFSIYYGSALHFMRMLHQKKLGETGYELKFIFKTPVEEIPVNVNDVYGALNYSQDTFGTVRISPLQTEVAVIYHRQAPEVSYLLLEPTANKSFQISTFVFDPAEPIYIESNGYYYPQTELTTNGYLGFKKIGDMLPYDYQPLTFD